MSEDELRAVEKYARLDLEKVGEYKNRLGMKIIIRKSAEEKLCLIAHIREQEKREQDRMDELTTWTTQAQAVFSGMLQILQRCVQVIGASEMDSKGLEAEIECFEREMKRMEADERTNTRLDRVPVRRDD